MGLVPGLGRPGGECPAPHVLRVVRLGFRDWRCLKGEADL